jgi:molecular chaperone GrpE
MKMTPEKDREKDIALKEQLEGGNESEDAKGDQVEGLEAAQSDLSLEERIKELEEQVNKNYDLYIRTYAEMENLKKRFQKERESYLKYGQEGLLRSLREVLA